MPTSRPTVVRMSTSVLALLAVVLGLPAGASAQVPTSVPLSQAQDRSVDAVVLAGSAFPELSAGPEITFRRPQVAQPLPGVNPSDCEDEAGNRHDPSTDHSCHQEPDVRIGGLKEGAPVDRLLGFRWTGRAYEQIPLQVDERFTRYLSNNASGFALYSGVDEHLTYAFDREGFRFTDDDPSDPCRATPRNGIVAQPDPIEGLDDNDEIALMWRDTGHGAAPPGTPLPAGITRSYSVRIVDPTNPIDHRYAYVMLAGEGGPTAAFDATNGHVRYERDADAGVYHFSESSYDNYGNAPQGPYFDDTSEDGNPATFACRTSPIRQRRELDTAWVTTDTYRFRYEGRWLMTEIHVRQADGSYGPDLIDRWKARAFQQDPSSETPCCGYEEEDTNWGGSGITLGELSGPVRTIRETWGADSGTNVIRREVFYRDQVQYQTYLRVHVIPPLDGIYQQWDYNAGRITRYYNPIKPNGVPVDGHGDEVFGNLDDPCNPFYGDPNGRNQIDQEYRALYKQAGLCADQIPYHQSVDIFDPTFSMPNTALQWEQLTGPYGTFVDRYFVNQITPGGQAQSVAAVPYYRDDSCFDDGTGSDPGPRLRLRSSSETRTYMNPNNPSSNTVRPRQCWREHFGLPNPAYAPEGDIRFFQGS
ncbi:MAG: hypothetical protein WD770_07570, partial [Actinomycetota bacterium]